MKRILFRVAIPMFCFILAGANAAHALDMREGEWEVVSETSMTMGAMSMPSTATKATYCLTREDPYPEVENEKDCKVVDQKIVGNKVSWRIVCKDAEGDGEITYGGTTYKGTFRFRTTEGVEKPKKGTAKSAPKARPKTGAEEDEGGEPMSMTMKLSGKYLGPCPAGQKSGPTRDTAKQVAKGQQAAAQAKVQAEQARVEGEKRKAEAEKQMAEAKKKAEENAAQGRKAEEFVKNTVVPPDDPGAYVQDGFAITKQCREKLGNDVPETGIYAVRFEKASAVGQFHKMEVERNEVLLDDRQPVPGMLLGGRAAKVKCGKGRITWSSNDGGMSVNGGIVYSGKTIEGAVRSTMSHGSEGKSVEVVKVTGKWLGGRDYTSQPRSSASGEATGSGAAAGAGAGAGAGKSAEKGKDAGKGEGSSPDSASQDTGTGTGTVTDKLKNPVKGIRNLFGF